MTDSPGTVVVHPDPDALAEAVAARLVTAVLDAQAERGHAHVVLTGGTVGIAVLAAVARSRATDAVDWTRVDVWWGDERFLAPGDPERNETQARRALLDLVPLPPGQVHPMPADGDPGDDVERAASRYAEELASAADPGASPAVPRFDVLLLGLGPDAHVASLFPGLPGVQEDTAVVVAVRDAPKPPPTRLSLTVPAIRSARQVWFVVAGADKESAVLAARGAHLPDEAPGSAVRGAQRTLWLLDRAAAGTLPA